jgi:hypothetical protein
MRTVDYVRRGFGTDESAHGSVADLVCDIPYLIVAGLVPPLAVVNEILRRGEVHAGMSGGCVWPPFELSPAEFAEVVADLEPARLEEVPSWVTTKREWAIWLAYRLRGVPVAENRQLSTAMAEADVAMKAAAARGDENERVKHLIELGRLANAYNALIARYRERREDS